jgi:hypothetical protein
MFNLAHQLICDACFDGSPKNSVKDRAHRVGWLFVEITTDATQSIEHDQPPDADLTFCPACSDKFLTTLRLFQAAERRHTR